MHKKLICFVFTLAAIFVFCVIPASADSADEDLPYIELTKFDDTIVSGASPGSFYVMGEYGYSLDFSLTLGSISCYGYEITYSYSGNQPTVTGVSLGGTSDNAFRNYYVDGTNLGKIRGSFKGVTGSDIGISFWSSGCYITLHSVRVFVVEDFQVELSAQLHGTKNVTKYAGYSSEVSISTYSTVSVDSWRNYDFLDFCLTIASRGISSISAVLFDNTSGIENVVPVEVSYLNYADYDGTMRNTCVNVSCDLRGVDPATAPDSTLYLRITSVLNSGETGFLQVTSLYGSVLMESPDEYLPWLKLFLMTQDSIYFGVDDIDAILSSLQGDFQSYFSNLNSAISSLQSSISNSFDDFKTFWSSSLDEKVASYQEWLIGLENEKWVSWYSKGFLLVTDKLDELINGTPVDETTTNEMTSAGDQLADLGQQMAAGTPQIDANNVNVSLGYIPTDGSADLAYSFFDLFWDQSYLLSMITTVVAVATVAFVFFGKKE